MTQTTGKVVHPITFNVDELRQKANKRKTFARDYFNWGIALLYEERFLEAQGVINKAVELNLSLCESNFAFKKAKPFLELAFKNCKSWSWVAVQLGIGNLRNGNLEEAEYYFKDLLNRRLIDNFQVYGRGFEYLCQIMFARMGTSLESANVVRDICLKDIERHGKKPWSSLYLGACSKVENRLYASGKYFADASSSHYRFSHAGIGCHSFQSFQTLSDQSSLSLMEKCQIDWLPPIKHFNTVLSKRNSPVIFTCCDSTYFEKFSEVLLHSCAVYAKENSAHFHVVNPTDKTFEQYSQLKERFEGVDVGLSFEHMSIKNIKPYYTLCRFLRVPELMQRWGRGAVMLDADGALSQSIDQFVHATQDKDIYLKIKTDDNYFPWRSITADLVVISLSKSTTLFLHAMSQYINMTFSPNTEKNYWWIDQNAIFAAYCWLLKNCSCPSIGNIYESKLMLPFVFAQNDKTLKDEFVAEQKRLLERLA